MGVTKHTRVTSEKVKDAALATVDYGDATITEPKFSEHLEHGRLGTVDPGGTYIHWETPFSATPNVILTGESAAPRLGAVPGTVRSSVNIPAAGGTHATHYVAWGAR